MRRILVATMLAALAASSGVRGADVQIRRANFIHQNHQTWKVRTDLGMLEVYLDAEGRTQFRGEFDGTHVGTEARAKRSATFLLFTRTEAGDEGGRAYLKFSNSSEGSTIYLTNHYDVLLLDPAARAYWKKTSPGSIQLGALGPYMPTAVLYASGSEPIVLAAYGDEIPLR